MRSSISKGLKNLLVLALYILLLSWGNRALAANICTDGLKELQGSQGIIQDKGGIWGYLEQTSSLRSESLLGLQIDGKLQRLISTFENLCSEGKTPTGNLHSQILGLLGDARLVFNRSGDRTNKKQLLEKLNNLKNKIEKLLAKLPSS